ncbi:unnamed protein product [Ilex paraguariensis]
MYATLVSDLAIFTVIAPKPFGSEKLIDHGIIKWPECLGGADELGRRTSKFWGFHTDGNRPNSRRIVAEKYNKPI